jgi:tetratricopeptide (TPR) repeat protein
MTPYREGWLSAWLGVAVVALCPVAIAQTGNQNCGNPFVNHYGPHDFRNTTPASRKLVEEFHFTIGIETLTRPKNTVFHEMAQDVEYTLGVFPNHPRALNTMVRLSERWKRDPPPGTKFSVECWFDRAVRFRPDDTVVRSLYAQWLYKRQRKDQAVRQLKIAQEHARENALSQYNIGLVAFEVGDFDLALQLAHEARRLGFPREDLATLLKKVNRWVDPPSEPVAPAPSTSVPDSTASSPSKTPS